MTNAFPILLASAPNARRLRLLPSCALVASPLALSLPPLSSSPQVFQRLSDLPELEPPYLQCGAVVAGPPKPTANEY